MGLGGGLELRVDAEMELDAGGLEPAAAPPCQLVRLGNLGDAEQPLVEGDGVDLPASGHGELDVVESDDAHAPDAATAVAGTRR